MGFVGSGVIVVFGSGRAGTPRSAQQRVGGVGKAGGNDVGADFIGGGALPGFCIRMQNSITTPGIARGLVVPFGRV
jgi:hypothetical protein